MNSYKKDYNKLYQLQDKFLFWWSSLGLPFYLTGGTALGRFYLNHRFSDDLDFFINADNNYSLYISELKNKIASRFTINIQQSLFADDYTRIFITGDDTSLKVEFINDVGYNIGTPADYQYGKIDNPMNILSNKLTAIVSRDEPKDIFDIIQLSINYSFSWLDIFYYVKQKALINENDLRHRSKNKFDLKRITIKKGASIGANSTILGGVTIGEYSMSGIASVITRDVLSFGLVYGSPARLRGWVDESGQKMKRLENGLWKSYKSVLYKEVNSQLIVVE